MTMTIAGRSTLALLLLALSACAKVPSAEPVAPSAPATPLAAYQIVDNLCERLDHAWLQELAGVPPKLKTFEPLPGKENHGMCHAGAGSTDRRTLILVRISTTVERAEPADIGLPKNARQLSGVGDRAWIKFGKPITHPNEQFGGETTLRIDDLMVAAGPARVSVTISLDAPSVPEESAAEALLTAYARRSLELMAGGQ
ncbi:hypothetical protein ACN26Y_13545 [Micromonospora sp. WMMD558]|uniref:hypothetical protein n=1 Tax=unclassified Micromonospora TaxID=2617518 RepID=UPI0012B4FC93|nr:hypothetical protein [Micromonospora sp. WMMC415]QGN47218.1 hypothetical protein GKC29_10405 [Micromonospora sp. WMMC415]